MLTRFEVGEGELLLERTDPPLQILGAVAGVAADDGDDGRRGVDHPAHVIGHGARPSGRHDEPVARFRSRGPAAHVGKVVGPDVDELEDVVRPVGVGDVQPDRPAGEVELCDGVDGVVVDGHEVRIGVGQPVGVGELVERRGRQRAEALVQTCLDHRQVEDERIPVDVRLGCQLHELVRSFVGHGESPLQRSEQ